MMNSTILCHIKGLFSAAGTVKGFANKFAEEEPKSSTRRTCTYGSCIEAGVFIGVGKTND
jgi:hypothetical protein